jgi:NAD+ kinase
MGKIRSVAIITKRRNQDAIAAATKLAKIFSAGGVSAFVVPPLRVRGCKPLSPEMAEKEVDLIVAIGGDGTTLKAFRMMPGRVPLLSINIGGHRGILSEIDTKNLENAVAEILAGKGFYDSRLRIQASSGKTRFPPALNEIMITRADLTRTPTYTIKLMGDEMTSRMDGVFISTPTGSTGHSLSIGGPVLHEGMDCLILTPAAAVNRLPQIVVPVEDILVRSTHKSYVVVDGQESFKVEAGERIRVSRYRQDARFLRLHKKGMRQLEKLGF